LTNAKPTVDEMPRDSLTAQTMSCAAMLVAVVVGLAVAGRLLDVILVGKEMDE
jgi:hypothetical protein